MNKWTQGALDTWVRLVRRQFPEVEDVNELVLLSELRIGDIFVQFPKPIRELEVEVEAAGSSYVNSGYWCVDVCRS